MSDLGAQRPAGNDGAGGAGDVTGVPVDDDGRAPGGNRRWLWIALAVVTVVAVVAAILLLTNEREPPEPAATLDPEVVTLPVPTPTVEAAELPEGTTFFQALPRTVLQFAVTGADEVPEARRAGALEAYRLEFDDGGGSGFTLHASQWRDPEAAADRLADVVLEQAAEVGVEPSASAQPEEPADEPAEGAEAETDPVTEPRFEQGPVVVDGAEVGSYLLRVDEDGTARVWWTNATALFSLEGRADALLDVYAAFPL